MPCISDCFLLQIPLLLFSLFSLVFSHIGAMIQDQELSSSFGCSLDSACTCRHKNQHEGVSNGPRCNYNAKIRSSLNRTRAGGFAWGCWEPSLDLRITRAGNRSLPICSGIVLECLWQCSSAQPNQQGAMLRLAGPSGKGILDHI
jgi:hypothetical protein